MRPTMPAAIWLGWGLATAMTVGQPAVAVGQGRGQQVAVAVRGPRFLLAPTSPKDAPVEVDVHRNALLRRSVSLNFEHPTVGQVLGAIERQTGLKFFYSPETLSPDRTVRLRADSITVAAALLEILVDADVDVLLSPSRQIALVRRGEGARVWQQGSIVGQVTDTTGRRVGGAEVFLEGTRWQTQTDTNGRYALAGIAPGAYTLGVRRFGYAKQSRAVTVRDSVTDTVDVVLTPVVARLQELVTTATGRQRRLDIANDVTTINADSVMQVAPIRSVTDLLDTRVPGLTVQRTSGAPGDPSRLRLRGVGSVLRNNDPIVIVDGVRVYAQQSANRSGNLASFRTPRGDSLPTSGYTSMAPSPLDYIDPNTIETIEVLKGPSAATLYGQDAANGVIVITTKRGKAGPTRWNASLEHGQTRMEGDYPELLFRWGREIYNNEPVNCPVSNLAGTTPCRGDSVLTFQLLNDPALTVLDGGHRTGGALTVSGGVAGLTYSLTGSYSDELGLIKLPGYEADRYQSLLGIAPPDWMRRPQNFKQWGVTTRIGAQLGSKADVGLTVGFSRSDQQKSSLESQLGSLMTSYLDRSSGLYYTVPDNVVSGQNAIATPIDGYYERALAGATQFTNGLTLNYRPRSWLTLNADAGLNIIHRSDQLLFPRGPVNQHYSVNGGDTTGYVNDGQGTSVVSTVNLRANALQPLGRGFQFRFAMGVNYTGSSTNDLAGGSSELNPGTTLRGNVVQFLDRAETSDATFGYYVEPSIGNSKFNFSSGLRLDGGKSYGANVSGLSLPKFPKLGFSYLVSDEPWFPFRDLVQSLRLRVSYGRASRQPGPTDKYRLYGVPAQVFADSQFVTGIPLAWLGNTEVRPERTGEFEGGLDADLLDNRLTLSLSGYRKTTDDALMEIPLAPSLFGDDASIIRNIGVIRNTGLELQAGAQLVRSGPVTWQTQVQLSWNRSLVVKLGPGIEPFYTDFSSVNPTGKPSNGIRIAAGYPPFGRWSRPILGYADANGNGVLEPAEIQLGDTGVYVGSTLPNYTAVFNTTLSFWHGALTVNASFAHDGGLSQENTQALGLARFSAGQQVPGTPLADQISTIDLTDAFASKRTDYNWIQTVATTRFNSLSVRYAVPENVVRRLGAQQMSVALQAGNLKLWTNYRGLDPNVNAFGTGNNVMDTGILPQPRTWQLQVQATY